MGIQHKQQNAIRLPEADRERLLSLIGEHGEAHVLELVGACRQSLARALAGLPIRLGTVALIRMALESCLVKH